MVSGRTRVGVIIGMKPALHGLVHGHVQQRHFQAGADALEEVEAGAGNLGAAFHVDRAEQFAEFQVVAGFEASAAKSRGVPTCLTTVKSSSPPAGTPS